MRAVLLLSSALMLAAAGYSRAAERSSPPGASYRIPYHLTETKHLLVRAKLNGTGPFNFIIVTGAPAFFLAEEAARKAGIAPGENGWAMVNRLEIEGGAVVEKVQARTEELFQIKGMNSMGLAGVRMDGVFGYNVLARFRMEIDLTRPTMTWTRLPQEPLPLPVLADLQREGPVTPSQGQAEMENLTRMASQLFQRKTGDSITPRGFIGIELAGEGGPRVRSVLRGSPAARAGFAVGDQLSHVALPGAPPRAVRASADVLRLTAGAAPGDAVTFTVLRGAKRLRLVVRAGQGGL